MKTGTISLIVLILFILVFMVQPLAQEQTQVTIVRGDTSGGVVIISARKGEKTIELTCNEGTTNCNRLQAGTFVMVELPKNQGMYDCANVRLYRNPADVTADERAGEYCLERK